MRLCNRILLSKYIFNKIPFKRQFSLGISRHFAGNPVFICGSGRSGTTAIYNALQKHPGISMAGPESPVIHHIGEIAYHYNNGEFRNYYRDSIHLKQVVFYKELNDLIYMTVFGKDYGLHHHLTLGLRGEKRLSEIRYWGTKAFPNRYQYEGLLSLYDRPRFLYLVRNGMEVVKSMTKFTGFRERGFEDLCRLWAESVDQYRYLESAPEALMIRFENLVERPGEVISGIIKFLSINEDNGPLEYLKNHVVHPLDKPDHKGSIKNALSERETPYTGWDAFQRSVFINICGNSMEHFGYKIPF